MISRALLPHAWQVDWPLIDQLSFLTDPNIVLCQKCARGFQKPRLQSQLAHPLDFGKFPRGPREPNGSLPVWEGSGTSLRLQSLVAVGLSDLGRAPQMPAVSAPAFEVVGAATAYSGVTTLSTSQLSSYTAPQTLSQKVLASFSVFRLLCFAICGCLAATQTSF